MSSLLIKRHRNVWILIAPILIVVCTLSILKIPSFGLQTTANPLSQALENIVAQTESEEIKANLRHQEGKGYQLELVLKMPIKSASCLVYGIDGFLIGQIESQKVYRFALPKEIDGFYLKDAIRDVEFLKMRF